MRATVFLLLSALALSAQDVPKASSFFSPTASDQVRALAQRLVHEKRVVMEVDRITGEIFVRAPWTNTGYAGAIELTVSRPKIGKPVLTLHATYVGEDWIFARSADFKIGENPVSLSDDHPNREVLHGSIVQEMLAWSAKTKEVQQVIKAVLGGRVSLCAIRGKRDVIARPTKRTSPT